MIKETDKTILRTISYAWKLTVIVAIILFVVSFDYTWPLSFILGAVTSLLNYNILIKSVDRYINKGQQAARIRSVGSYLIRFGIYGFVMYQGIITESINIYTLIPGFFVVKIAIILDAIINREK